LLCNNALLACTPGFGSLHNSGLVAVDELLYNNTAFLRAPADRDAVTRHDLILDELELRPLNRHRLSNRPAAVIVKVSVLPFKLGAPLRGDHCDALRDRVGSRVVDVPVRLCFVRYGELSFCPGASLAIDSHKTAAFS
jgi:hypothetical protein